MSEGAAAVAAPAVTGEPVLVCDRLTKRFGGLVAVDRLDLSVAEGSIHSVIGPNGAGKTTVFNCIMEFYPPDGGEILFLGERIDGLTPDAVAKAGINRTYQNIRLFGNITAIENILVGMHLHLRSTWWGAILNTRYTREDEQRGLDEAYELLKFVGLAGRGDIYARNLSYGEQRPARGSAGRLRPGRGLLMLDEPMAGMNPRESSDMMEFVRRVRDEMGITILLIEHQMRVVMGMSRHRHGAGPRGEDRGGEPRGGPGRPAGDRGLSRHRCRPAPRRPRRENDVAVLEVDNLHVFYDNIHALRGALARGRHRRGSSP